MAKLSDEKFLNNVIKTLRKYKEAGRTLPAIRQFCRDNEITEKRLLHVAPNNRWSDLKNEAGVPFIKKINEDFVFKKYAEWISINKRLPNYIEFPEYIGFSLQGCIPNFRSFYVKSYVPTVPMW